MRKNQFKSKKVAIIGAGIVGLYLGWKLSEKGHEVTIFEKKGKIGKEACSGLFSERILQFIPESSRLIQNQIKSVLIHFPRKTISVKFSKTFFVMNHAELDKQVADLARQAGAEILLQKPIDSLPQGFDRIIGCDGAQSIVRKNLGLKEASCRLGIQGFVTEENQADYVETWPIKQGFSWKIPRGKESMKFPSSRESSITEYGIIAKPGLARKTFEEFLKKNNLELQVVKSAMVPQGFIIPKSSSVTLCGDAAGLTKPWSGGGVIWGLAAADMLLNTFPDFLKYRKKVERYFRPKIILSKTATKMAYFLGFKMPWVLPKNVKIESDFLL